MRVELGKISSLKTSPKGGIPYKSIPLNLANLTIVLPRNEVGGIHSVFKGWAEYLMGPSALAK